MKRFYWLFVSSLLTASIALGISASVLGKWSASIENRGSKFSLGLEIGENASRFTVHCAIQGLQAETVTIEVPTKIEGNTFHILTSAAQEKKVGPVNCKISVSPISYNFEATDTKLKVSTTDGRVVYFDRVP